MKMYILIQNDGSFYHLRKKTIIKSNFVYTSNALRLMHRSNNINGKCY